MKHFHVQLFNSDADAKPSSHPIFDEQGNADIPLPQYIMLSGFSQDQTINLQPYWNELISQGVRNYETTVTIRETIIKFGDTIQLVDHYLLKFQMTYAAYNHI